MFRSLSLLAFVLLLVACNRAQPETTLPATDLPEPETATSVSYTHLDVYKRQGFILQPSSFILGRRARQSATNVSVIRPGVSRRLSRPLYLERGGKKG